MIGLDIPNPEAVFKLGEKTEVEIVTGRQIEVRCTARTVAQTGVEMEALTGVAVARLTIYDMCKAVDKQMELGAIKLVTKTKD